MAPLRTDLAHIRRQGFAVNEGRSERGVVAIGRPVRRPDGSAAAGISISMPSVRYDPQRRRSYVATLGIVAGAVEAELRETT
jgi:DNA-binding IclR family transcriptional regulator